MSATQIVIIDIVDIIAIDDIVDIVIVAAGGLVAHVSLRRGGMRAARSIFSLRVCAIGKIARAVHVAFLRDA